MSAETIRIINASLFAVLVFMWTLWLVCRLETVRSRLVAALAIPVWCWLSMTAYAAAQHGGPLLTRLTYLGPFVLTLLVAALVYDTLIRPPRPDWAAILRRVSPFPFDESNRP